MPLLISDNQKVTDTQEINQRIAEHQEEYATLPAHYKDGVVSFAFELDEEDIENILKHKRIYVLLQTGGTHMVPINVGVEPESFDEACEYARESMKSFIKEV